MLQSPVREERARAWLRELDPHLDIVWVPVALAKWDGERLVSHQGRYALVYRYPSNDPMQQISREMGVDPYDHLGWFTVNPQEAATRPLMVDECEPFIKGFLSKMDGTRHRLRDRMRETSEYNHELTQRRQADFADEAGQRAADVRREAIRSASRKSAVPVVPGF